ncbi:hypothetical protein ACEPAG_7355 [Sanghuangporus baumii]
MPSYINLNNGSYGSLPLPVLTACEKMSREIEANSDRFMRSTYIPILRDVRARVAALVGADTDECVIVPNATHGINTVLRNLNWNEGDTIVKLIFPLIFPTAPSIIIDGFRTHLKSLSLKSASVPGVLIPWKELVKTCKEEDVVGFIDGAHSIGQEVDINLKDADPDFWISNCHKWLYAKRGCAVLYVPKRNQHLIKSSLPTSSNYASPTDPPESSEAPNFIQQFLWTATIDLVPFLSVYAGDLDFWQRIGGEHKINEYCHGLALIGGEVDVLQRF